MKREMTLKVRLNVSIAQQRRLLRKSNYPMNCIGPSSIQYQDVSQRTPNRLQSLDYSFPDKEANSITLQ